MTIDITYLMQKKENKLKNSTLELNKTILYYEKMATMCKTLSIFDLLLYTSRCSKKKNFFLWSVHIWINIIQLQTTCLYTVA